tara:strand:+ start:139 stop:717 length:579 start_codon:yes stop_codon:yes gene_type:complete
MKKQFPMTLYKLIIIGMLTFQTTTVKAAEEVAFVNGIFRRNISVKDIELATQNKISKEMEKSLNLLSNENPEKLSRILTQTVELPLILTSKLMYTKIGEVILKRISKIIYPLKIQNESVTIPAIRSAVIKGLDKGNGKINLILFLKSYPNKTIAVNIPALFKVLQKVESITDVIQFFSDYPLEGLKKSPSKT